MINFLSTAENPDLRSAGNLIVVEGFGFVALAFAFSQLRMPAGEIAAFLGLLLFNFVPMYYLAKAAHTTGRSAVLYGLVASVPPGAIFAYFTLRSNERWR